MITFTTTSGKAPTYDSPDSVEEEKRAITEVLTRVDGYAEVPRKDGDGVLLIPVRHITKVNIRERS